MMSSFSDEESFNASLDWNNSMTMASMASSPASALAIDPTDGDFEFNPMLGDFLAYFVQGLYGTVFIVGLLGNTLVIYVVLRYTKMQTVTNLYILNLAIADECFLIGIPFIMTTMGLGYWPFGNVMCKIYMTTTSVNQFTSSLLLTVMSADRYIAVCHPINSPKFRTPMIAKVVSTTAWAASFLMIVPIFLYAHTQQVNADWPPGGNSTGLPPTDTTPFNRTTTAAPFTQPIVSCNIYWPESEYMNGQAAFTLYTFTLAFAIPLVLILVFYILVIRKLQTVGPSNKSKEKKRSHRKVTRLVLTVVTVYVLCWLPYWVSQVSLIFTPPKSTQSQYVVAVFLLAGCLGYSNSAVNPILYAFLSDNFKKSFMKACTCAERRDVNMALTGENSVFTRRYRGSERCRESRGSRLQRIPAHERHAVTNNQNSPQEHAHDSPANNNHNGNSAPAPHPPLHHSDSATAVLLVSPSIAASAAREAIPLLDITKETEPLTNAVNGSDIIYSQL